MSSTSFDTSWRLPPLSQNRAPMVLLLLLVSPASSSLSVGGRARNRSLIFQSFRDGLFWGPSLFFDVRPEIISQPSLEPLRNSSAEAQTALRGSLRFVIQNSSSCFPPAGRKCSVLSEG